MKGDNKMKVTRNYIRNLVLEALSEMEKNFDFMFSLGQILQVAQDNDIKIQGYNQEVIDIDGMTVPSEGGFTTATDRYRISMSYDANNKAMLYRLSSIEDKKNIMIAQPSVKTSEDVEGLIGLIYAVSNDDAEYLDKLSQIIAMDNERR